MKLIFTCFFFLCVSAVAYTYSSGDDQNAGYNADGGQNKNSSNASTKDSSTTKTDSGNNELVKKMDQSTEKGLKVFDKILGKDGDQAKQDFAQNIGQNPTADELGGDGAGEGAVKNPFGEMLGGESNETNSHGE